MILRQDLELILNFSSFADMRLILFISLLFFSIQLAGQGLPPTGDLESPYQAIYQHLYYLQADSYDPAKAAEALTTIGDSATMVELAIQLKQVLDGNGYFIYLEKIPRDPAWRDTLTRSSTYTPFPGENPTIFVSEQDSVWRYSAETVKAIPEMHQRLFPFGTDRLVNWFGQRSESSFLGIYAWQWIGLLLLPVFLFLLYWLIYILIFPILRSLANRYQVDDLTDQRSLRHADRYLTLWILVWVSILVIPILQLPVRVNEWVLHGLRITAWIFVMMLGLRILDLIFVYLRKAAEKTESKTDDQLVPILRKTSQIALVFLILIPILRLLEVNLTALIAGLSIGGIALALAAQDTVKNLISSALIFFDKPYQIGDYIVAGGVEGTVVEIGFRSTRMMTIDSSIITIPNSNMINDQVVNLGLRQYRLVHFMIGVVYSTPADQIKRFIESLREMANAHPDTRKDLIYIYLHELNNSSIDIRFRVPVVVPDFKTELIVREELVMGIIELAHEAGISFAFPSQSLYVESFPGQIANPAAPVPDPASWTDKERVWLASLQERWTVSRPESPEE